MLLIANEEHIDMDIQGMLADKKLCTGCGVCTSVCTHGAIKMIKDSRGFSYPVIDVEKCVDCKRCVSVCPIVNESQINDKVETYAMKNKNDEIREISSSGGVFYELAKSVIELNGVVYGAAFDNEWVLKHIRVNNIAELQAVCRSKYVQSEMGNIYQYVIDDIRNGKFVLFSGTPCQVEAVYRLVHDNKSDDSNLLLCDLICHGVPSPLIWKDYINLLERENDSKVTYVALRDKVDGWHERTGVRYKINNDDKFYFDRRYTEFFIDNYSIRESCNNCQYANVHRCSDITLGDFWGIEETGYKSMDDDKGVSAILVHSLKGKEWLDKISENFVSERVDTELVKRNQKALNTPFSAPSDINQFWRDYYSEGLQYVYDKYIEKRKDTPIDLQKYNTHPKFWVVLPDGTGSLGDEAMVRGVLRVLGNDDITVVSPDLMRQWSDRILDVSCDFSEVSVPLVNMKDVITCGSTMLMIGADVLDGTCGIESSLYRLDCASKCIELGGKVHAFCSFRSDVDDKIISSIKGLGKNISWHLRDELSVQNFERQTGLKGDFFPDFAYYCNINNSSYVEKVLNDLSDLKRKGRNIIGLNFSQQSCNSFYSDNKVSSWNNYVYEVINLVKQKLDNPFFVLISHDERKWDTHLSDTEFQKIAADMLNPDEYLLLKDDITYPELLLILKGLDYLISGRMHLSVAAFRSGIVPIVYTGDSKDGLFSMAEKVRGMFMSRIGRDDLVATTLSELRSALEIIIDEKNNLVRILQKNNEENTRFEEEALVNLRNSLSVIIADDNDIESANLEKKWERTLQRNLVLRQRIVMQQREVQQLENESDELSDEVRKCKDNIERQETEIQKQSKEIKDKTKELKKQEIIIQKQKQEILNKQGHIEQLLEVDRHYQNMVNSRGWKLVSFPGRVFEKCFPVGTPRRMRVSLMVKYVKACNWNNIKFVCGAFKRGGIKQVKKELNDFEYRMSGATELPLAKPDVVEIEEITSIDECEKLMFTKYETPKVSIVIPVYNQFTYTYNCLKSILENSGGVSYEIIIADDVSNDLTIRLAEVAENINIVRNKENQRFLRNCNHAAQYAKGEYILFLNNDTQVQENWLQPLIDLIERDETIGMVGSKLVYPDGTLQEAGGILFGDGRAWNYGNGQNPANPEFNYVKEVDYISGASIMIRTSLWKEIGGFDEFFAPAYCEDSDLAFEVRKHGYKLMYQPLSVVVHFEGKSNGTDLNAGVKQYQVDNSKKLKKKWKDEFAKQSPTEADLFHAKDRSQGKKTILVIDHYVPQFDKDAGSKTTWQYLKMFVKKGYNVKFIGDNFYQDEPYCTALQQEGIEVLYGPWYAQNYKQWIIDNQDNIDFVYLNRPHITEKYIDFLREETDIKCIYYGHDLHFLRLKREYELSGDEKVLAESEEWRKKEFDIMRKSSINYYPSYIEVDEIHKIDKDIPAKAITAYVYEEFLDDMDVDFAKKEGLLFVGGFGHPPNADAVIWFVENVYPLIRQKQDIPFYIVGSNAPDKIKKLDGKNGIIVKGFVSEEELAELYNTCKIVVVPLRYGAGVKGKVVEALYNGTPMVSTTVGIEGIPEAETFMEVADEAETFASKVLSLYNDNDRLTETVQKYQSYVKENNSIDAVWNIIKEDFQ